MKDVIASTTASASTRRFTWPLHESHPMNPCKTLLAAAACALAVVAVPAAQAPPPEVAALKLEYWADPRTSVFAAAQRFQDRNSGNLDPERIAQPLVRGSGFSAGARFADSLGSGMQRELAGEWARSRSRAEGQPWQYGQARVLDGSLQWPSAGLRGGWHRIDPDYASPSSQAVARTER